MAKIFVTGASGFIGKALIQHLLTQGHDVAGLSRSGADLSHPRYTHHVGDLKLWREKQGEFGSGFDVLVNLAWAASGGPDRDNAEVQLENVANNNEAIFLAKHIGAARFVGVGTITQEEQDLAEFAPNVTPGPGYVYGLAKNTAEAMGRYYAAREGLEHVWIKLGNTYGLNDPTTRFLNMALNRMLNDEAMDFTAGTQMYDFVYLEDTVRGVELAALKGKPGQSYYLGSGEARPLREFIESLAAVTKTKGELRFGGMSTAGVSLDPSAFSITDLHSDTGYDPHTRFEDGVRLLIEEAQA